MTKPEVDPIISGASERQRSDLNAILDSEHLPDFAVYYLEQTLDTREMVGDEAGVAVLMLDTAELVVNLMNYRNNRDSLNSPLDDVGLFAVHTTGYLEAMGMQSAAELTPLSRVETNEWAPMGGHL